ncbi:hypothetical protein NC661_11235 [Aquibacillus koreensis]|uniref:Uncharacterized protein n=1 Tax=Aquibacillus koreensis TaxID=279446 RepID=A0A9X3WJ23_9BACI|nr:hypothetical protein [Aquibacillus koreensis]MCT2537711.1 hypothetical protein [Aquibacillus koreensis]MDC3420942.1 hypothetical protein [Aquibacillus koreensis]
MKYICLFLYFVMILFVVGCGPSSKNVKDSADSISSHDVQTPLEEVSEGDFVYRLVTDQEEYKEGSSVSIYAELEYIGSNDQITIYHAASPFHFPLEEKTRGYQIGYGMEEPLLNTTLVKNKPIREQYKGSGGYGSKEDANYEAFVKKIMSNHFPKGYYVMDGFADFYVETSDGKRKYEITATIDFKVEEK